MTPLSTSSIDERWNHGMDGWIVRVVLDDPSDHRVLHGEVTGYSHDGDRIWVVADGENEPMTLRWDQVRPA